MEDRRNFARSLIESHPEVSLNELDQSQELSLIRNNQTVKITVPISLEVKEYFIDIFISNEKIFSDWKDIYEINNETEEELERSFRQELSTDLNNFLYKDFEILTEGHMLKAKKLLFK